MAASSSSTLSQPSSYLSQSAQLAAPPPPPLTELEERILAAIERSENGVMNAAKLPKEIGENADVLLKHCNNLLFYGRLEPLNSIGGLAFRISKSTNLIDLGQDERLVYQIIEKSANKGVWVKDIRTWSNIEAKQLTKVIKTLETRKLIKAITSVTAAKKKMYMLYTLEPDPSITGGAWYSDQEFDEQFARILRQICSKFLDEKKKRIDSEFSTPLQRSMGAWVSVEEIQNYVEAIKASNEKLRESDYEALLDTLVYAGRAERTITESGSKLFRSKIQYEVPSGILFSPCGQCPVFDNCCEGGDISPQNCIYMKDW